MNTVKAELSEFESLRDLKPLLSAEGPCLSFYMPLAAGSANQPAKANALEWRELVRSVEPKIKEAGAGGRELLEPVTEWQSLLAEGEPQGQSIGVFRSAEVFRVTWLDERVASRAVLGPHFFVRPMLPELTRGKAFYILALSQKNVRLLRCTMRSSEEIPLPKETQTSFDEYMNTAKPDHMLDNRSSAGPDAGGGRGAKGVMFGSSAD